MSKSRHRSEPAVRGYAVTHPKATVLVAIEGGWDQLLCPASGVMTIFTPAGSWVIPPNRALWVPDGTPATVRTTGRVAVRALYLSASLHALPAETRAVNLPPLTRELVLHAVRSCPLDLAHATDAALLTLLIDQLQTLPDAPLQLPRPRDPARADMADAIIAEPAEDLNELAARAARAGAPSNARSSPKPEWRSAPGADAPVRYAPSSSSRQAHRSRTPPPPSATQHRARSSHPSNASSATHPVNSSPTDS